MRSLFLILVLSLVSAACGFHLRGNAPLPAWLERVQVTGDPRFRDVMDELRHALQRAGAVVVEQPASADAIIVIEGEQRQRRILSVDSNGRPREYELSYRLSYRVRDADGETRIPPRTLVRSREYTFDEAEVLGKSTEREQLWRELRRSAVEAMVDQLRYSSLKSR